jgi:hypothetical protein
MLLTMTSWLVSGVPRQFIVIWENSRCSIWGCPAGARREVAAGDLQAGLGGQRGQPGLPRAGAVAVGAQVVAVIDLGRDLVQPDLALAQAESCQSCRKTELTRRVILADPDREPDG